MRFIHLSDLHLGKSVNKFSMLEDQQYILTKIINIVDEKKPDGVFISGDIYDNGIPPIGAVELFDDFLTRLSKRNLKIFIISGNHDSAERISFGSKLMESSGVYFSPVYTGNVEPITFEDENGSLNIYMLPFIKPVHVKAAFEEESDKIYSYTDACRVAIEHMKVDTTKRNVLLAHQFVTGASRCDSEEILASAGGSDNVDGSVFDCFDYVALGHLHGPQKVGRDTIRYCGTPLKYSFSEINQKKSVTLIDFGKKGEVEISQEPLVPRRNLIEIKGKYEELMSRDFYKDLNLDDYYKVILTDESDVMEGFSRLRTVYPNIMTLEYDNTRTRKDGSAKLEQLQDVKNIDPVDAFKTFFNQQNTKEMSENQEDFVKDLVSKIWNR